MSVPTTSTSWTNGMSAVLRRLVVRRLPLLARLALLFRGELRAVLVADVAEPRAARGVLGGGGARPGAPAPCSAPPGRGGVGGGGPRRFRRARGGRRSGSP